MRLMFSFLFCALTLSLVAQQTDYRLFDPNNIAIWFANNGDVAFNPKTNAAGLEYPARSGRYLVFESGVVWGCFLAGELRVGGSTYRHGLQPGTIKDGYPSDPKDPRFRIYRINKSQAHDSVKDYREWPCNDGAPCDPITKRPIFFGDDQMWWVSNDLDPSITHYLYGTNPIGIEVQTLVWSEREADWMNDLIFVKHTMINKNKVDSVEDMFLGLWVDFDIGDANDDYVGCDTIRRMTFGYNGVVREPIYTIAPACGYMFIQTPIVKGSINDQGYFKDVWRRGYKNVGLSGYVLQISEPYSWPGPNPSIELYKWMQGILWNGPIINPFTNKQTRFMFSGNPVTNAGWIDGIINPPGDRRTLLSCGPFTMAPGDTQEVVYAILAAQGIDRLQSVRKLQWLADHLKSILPVSVDNEINYPDKILIENYPNPFSSATGTTITFSISPKLNGDSKNSRVEIYDALGRRVRFWSTKDEGKNFRQLFWDGKDEMGNALPAGVYFLRMKSSYNFQSQKLMLSR